MNREDEQVNSPLPELVAAFQDLTRLSHHGLPTTTETPSIIAHALLERIMRLCQASQGVIFLMIPPLADSEPLFLSSALNGKTFRLFALHGVNEEEARTVLTTFTSERFWTFSPSCDLSWLRWRLPLTLSFPSQQGRSREDQEQPAMTPSLDALLLLGWVGQSDTFSATVMKKACVVLPSVADAIGTVIVRVLSSEYMAELKTSTDQKSLREMELLKAELLATVSHELRSPLASMKGYAATLLRHDRRISREERREFLLAIHEASDHLAKVIDSLLEVSELKTGMVAIERMSVNISRLVREAIMVAEQQREGTNTAGIVTPATHQYLTFVVHIEDHHGAPTYDELIIEADYSRLREVLDHLLQNAIIHAPDGGVIDVTVRPVFSSKDLKQFSVSSPETVLKLTALQQRYQQVIIIGVHDNGRGIPTQHLTRIFEPFYRVDTRLTREVNGLGLGLAISRHLVELHDGMLWVESEMGKGSTFYVCLPRDAKTQSQRTE